MHIGPEGANKITCTQRHCSYVLNNNLSRCSLCSRYEIKLLTKCCHLTGIEVLMTTGKVFMSAVFGNDIELSRWLEGQSCSADRATKSLTPPAVWETSGLPITHPPADGRTLGDWTTPPSQPLHHCGQCSRESGQRARCRS